MTLLKKWMADHGYTDEALSERVGVTRVQILRLRLGQNRPSQKTARKLEEVTKIPAGDLMMDGAGQ